MKTLREMIDIVEGNDKYAELRQKIRDLSAAGNEHEANKQRHELNRLMMIDRDREARGVAEGEQGVAEASTPESVAKINKLFQDKK